MRVNIPGPNTSGPYLVHDDGVWVTDAPAGAMHLSALLPVSGLCHEAVTPPDLITLGDRDHHGCDADNQRLHCDH